MAMFLGRKARAESAAYLPLASAKAGTRLWATGPCPHRFTSPLSSVARVKFLSYWISKITTQRKSPGQDQGRWTVQPVKCFLYKRETSPEPHVRPGMVT